MKSNMQLIINNKAVAIKEFNGQRVVTFKDIDIVHQRPIGTADRNFREHKERFVEGEDFVRVQKSQNHEIRGLVIPNRGTTLLTETGYLMLVKSFTDNLAWKVQRELVNCYFGRKESATKRPQSPKVPPLSSVNMMVKNVKDTLDKAKVEPLYIAAEVKRLYTDLGYEVKAPLLTDKENMPKLYDNTEMAKELEVYSTSGKPHSQAMGAILKQLYIPESDIVTTAFSRNGHDDVTIQYKPSVFENVRLWLAENGYPTKISYVDSKGNPKTYTVVYKAVA